MVRTPKELFAFASALVLADEARRAEADAAIEAWVRTASVAAIVRAAIVARASFNYASSFAPRSRLGVAALFSMHRNGYVREVALDELARSSDDVVIPFLLLRADDIVPSLRACGGRGGA